MAEALLIIAICLWRGARQLRLRNSTQGWCPAQLSTSSSELRLFVDSGIALFQTRRSSYQSCYSDLNWLSEHV